MRYVTILVLLVVLSGGAIAKPLSATRDSLINSDEGYRSFVKHYASVIKPEKWSWKYNGIGEIHRRNATKVNAHETSKYYFVPSPDRRYFIDAYSTYSISDECRDEVDSSVRLLNAENDSSAEIFFTGPSGGVSVVFWLNNEQFVMVYWCEAFSETLSGSGYPPIQFVLALYDVQKWKVEKYNGPFISRDRFHSVKEYPFKELQRLKNLGKRKK